jgi:hypothetical protein
MNAYASALHDHGDIEILPRSLTIHRLGMRSARINMHAYSARIAGT